MKAPLIIGVFENENQLNIVKEEINQYFQFIVHKTVYDSSQWILSCYFFSQSIDLQSLRKNFNTIIINPKGITKYPKYITKQQFTICFFHEQEINKIQQEYKEQQNSKHIITFGLVGPQLIFTFISQVDVELFISYLKQFENLVRYNQIQDEEKYYVSMIYCQDIITLGEIKQDFAGKCYYSKENLQKEPFFLCFDIFRALSFTINDNTEIIKQNKIQKQNLQNLQNGKRTGRILFKLSDKQLGMAIYYDLCLLYRKNIMEIKYLWKNEQFYIAGYFNPSVNINAMYYTLKIPVNRYCHTNFDIRKPPSFIDEGIFYSMLFEEDICQKILNYQPKLSQNTILPKIIIMNLTIIQHDQLSYILQSLFADRLQLTAVTSQFGACYIGILFIEKYLPGKRAVDFLKDYGCEFCQQKGEGFKPRAQFLINKLMFSQQNLLLLEANVSSKYEPKIIENSVNIDKLTIKPAIFDNQKTIIIIDFEAYLYRNDIFIASEFAAVFVEDNKIINTFHSLISPSQQQLEILADPRHQQIIKNTTSLTALNHTNVQGNTLNQIIEQFTILTQQYPSFILTAKAPQLEIQILHSINSPFQYKVTDFLTLRPSLTFKSAHSLNREKFYCNTHTKGRQIGLYGQAVHCALDDCVYLSKLLINEPVAETNFFGEFQNNFIISNNLQVQKSFTTKWPELIAPKFVFSCENNEDLTIILSDFQIIFDARYLIKKVEQQDQLLCSMLFVQSDVPLYCCKLFKQGVETRFFNGIENIPQELMFTEHEFQQIYQ